MQLSDSVEKIHNIGAQRLKYLNNLGINTVLDLIEHFPRDYEDRSDIKTIDEIVLNEINTFEGEIISVPNVMRMKNMIIVTVQIKDETGYIYGVWYNQQYLKNLFKIGQKYIFTGKCQLKMGKKQMVSPEYEPIEKKEVFGTGRILPIYSLTKGLSQKIFRSLIKDTIEKSKNQFLDIVPKKIRMENNLCDRNFAVYNIHFPVNNESFFIARKRLVFEEFLVLQTALLRMKEVINQNKVGVVIEKTEDEKNIIDALGFKLTNAQKKVIDEIKEDFSSGNVMNRLVQGDVGSGKTAVAMVCAYITINAGFQCALMAPTEVLAKQHYLGFKAIFEKFGIEVVFLGGSMKAKEKREALEKIKSNNKNMIIGTHAVIQEGVEFNNLGFVITDEQHRFGVNQRITLTHKGISPHVLVMTATPIPRTLALILYGDLDISIIDELPPGRQKIDTRAVGTEYRERIYNFIKKEIDKGRQAYIVCSAIDENDKNEREAVLTYAENLKNEAFINYSVGIMHGKLKPAEKQEVMEQFVKGEINVLVSTTVIEVGVNVPNATVMVIENSEMFGLSQLHQLRGRVGRGAEESYCILISDSKNKITKERLKVMTKTTDGFEISEKDLSIRGPGEFFGTKQHGVPMLKIANLYKDMELLKLAQKSAKQIIEDDYNLEKEENKFLEIETRRIFIKDDIGI